MGDKRLAAPGGGASGCADVLAAGGEPRDGTAKTAAPRPAEQKPCAPQSGGRTRAGPKKKKKRMGPLPRFLIKLAVIAGIFAGVFTFVLGLHIMHGYGMNPHIKDGDLLVTYKLEAYHVGDAVVYRRPDTGETAVSRIVAIGANQIQITEIGELLINGSVPDESVFYPTRIIDGSAVTFPYQMREGGYFLLDDFRTQGNDSRVFGEVTEDDLLGKVVYVFRRRGI